MAHITPELLIFSVSCWSLCVSNVSASEKGFSIWWPQQLLQDYDGPYNSGGYSHMHVALSTA